MILTNHNIRDACSGVWLFIVFWYMLSSDVTNHGIELVTNEGNYNSLIGSIIFGVGIAGAGYLAIHFIARKWNARKSKKVLQNKS